MSDGELVSNKTYDEIQIGDSASTTRILTEDDLHLFARVSGDLNPTHLDPEFAIEGKFGEDVVGHAMWGGSLFSSVLGNQLPGSGTVYRGQNLQFLKPILLGDRVTITVTAEEKRDADKSMLFACKIAKDDGTVVVTGTAEVIAPTEHISRPQSELAGVTIAHHDRYESLMKVCKGIDPIPTVVCHPCSDVALEGAIEAAQAGIIKPILVGPKARVEAVAEESKVPLDGIEIIDVPHSHESARRSVEMIREGHGELLMKGSLHTDELMREVTSRGTGLRTERRLSHVFVMDVPTYPKTLMITDAAINIYPSLEDKMDILSNSIELAHALGVEVPKVAILSAVETVTPKIASTLEAAALCKMADRGQIKGAVLDGPLAFDNAISAEAARTKGIQSEVAGQADIFLVPDMEAGNMLAKQLTFLSNADAAGIVLGARVPIILTSRADTARARIASCAVSAILAHARRSQTKMAAE